MNIENIELINLIKEEKNIVKKIDIIIEYLNQVKVELLKSRYVMLSLDELLEILGEISKIDNSSENRSLKEEVEEDIIYDIESIACERVCCGGQTRDLDIVNMLICILEYTKKYNYKVTLKKQFTKFYNKLKVGIEDIDNFCREQNEFCRLADEALINSCFEYEIKDEYNLDENDEDYEFSISEAIDNMYGK